MQKEKEHVGFWVDTQTYIRLHSLAERKGMSVSDFLRSLVQEVLSKEDTFPVVVLDEDTARNFFALSEKEVRKELEKGGWEGVKADSILGYAIAYAQRKYPEKHREIKIFSTVVEGFTTGMWSSFGQENDPLMAKAMHELVKLFGGSVSPDGIHVTVPLLKHRQRVAITGEAITLLEKILFGYGNGNVSHLSKPPHWQGGFSFLTTI
jgi:hypothetical protein